MLSAPRSALAAAAFLSVLALCASAQPAVLTDEVRLQEEAALRAAEPDIRAREARIKLELAAPLPADGWAREWAGAYYVGDGLGMNVNILIAPNAGITYTWHGCMGLYDGNHGEVADAIDLDGDGKADALKINWKLHRQSGYHFDADTFYFIRWTSDAAASERLYFVPKTQMLHVVNEYNAGGYSQQSLPSAPRKHNLGERPQDRLRAQFVKGLLKLPDPWAKRIQTSVDAVVTAATPLTARRLGHGASMMESRITLDRGSADGVYQGMECWVREISNPSRLTVIHVNEHTCEAEFRSYRADNAEAVAGPAIGQTIRISQDAIPPNEDAPDANP